MHLNLYLRYLFNCDVNIKVIKVKNCKPQTVSVSVSLKLKDKLSNVREKLRDISEIGTNKTYLFAKKNHDNDSWTITLREEERKKCLKNIIEKKSKTLYLFYKDEIDWEILNKNCKLDFGRNIIDHDEFKVAKKRAFEMKNCKVEISLNSKNMAHTF